MPDGTFRRPPQLWEQRIAGLVAVNSVGTVSGTGTSEVGSELTPGDGGPAPEPPTIAPTPTVFSTPSTPTVTGTVQGIRVTWDGNNSSGELYPPDAYVEIHVDTTGATFTPSTSTLRGTLLRAGTFSVMGLTASTTYFVRLVGKDGQGNATAASTAASSQTGLTTSSDYGTATITAGAVSFDARAIGGITTTVGTTAPTSPVTGDIWLDSTGGAIVHKRWSGSAWVTQAWGSDSLSANCITATQIAAGAVTAGAIAAGSITTAKLDASAVTADKIAAGAITAAKISAGAIDGQTITGATVQTASSGARVVLTTGAKVGYVDIYSANGSNHSLYGDLGDLIIAPSSRCKIAKSVQIEGDLSFVGAGNGDITATTLDTTGNISGGSGLIITGAGVDMQGVYDNNTTGLAPVGITTTGRLRRNGTSTQRIKYDISTLAGELSDSVDLERQTDVTTCDPMAILDVAVVEFSVIDEGLPTERRLLGVIAEDVDDKLPIAVLRGADGRPVGVSDQALVSALLAVVKQQQQTITDLTARVTALEGA